MASLRPSRRAWTTPVGRGVLLLGLMACALLVANTNATMLALLIAAASVWLTGSLFVRNRPALQHLSRSAASWVIEGESLTVELDLRLTRPLGGVLLEEVFPGEWVNLRWLKAGNHLLRYSLIAPRRGLYQRESLRLRSRDLLGLREQHLDWPLSVRLLVLPRSEALEQWSLLNWLRPGFQSSHSDPDRSGQGEEFYRVREYRPGDPLRTIDWKATARARTPIVREFSQAQEERGITLLLHLGTQALCTGNARQTNVEAAVRAAASLGRHCLENQQTVRLVSPSKLPDRATGLRWQTDAWQGPLALEPFLARLALLEPGSQMVSLDQAPLEPDDPALGQPVIWIDAAPNHLSLEMLLAAWGRGQSLAALLVDWASFRTLERTERAPSLTLLGQEEAAGERRFTQVVQELSASLPELSQVVATQLVQQVSCQGHARLSLSSGQSPYRLSRSLRDRGIQAVVDAKEVPPDFPTLRQVGLPLLVLRPGQPLTELLGQAVGPAWHGRSGGPR